MSRDQSILASLVLVRLPKDLEIWALERLRAESDIPLLFGGREPEAPHEAVAECFKLNAEILTREKRGALIGALRNSYHDLHENLARDKWSADQMAGLEAWAEVVESAKPPELSSEAATLLHLCLERAEAVGAAVGLLASAVASQSSSEESNDRLWRQLLDLPQSAALAYRNLLPSISLEEAVEIWVALLDRHANANWPPNPRLLIVPLLRKAEESGESSQFSAILRPSLVSSSLLSTAIAQLQRSKTESIRRLVDELQPHSSP